MGILKKEALSAYDIQKLVEYRNISRWVKISTPSVYKKVIQLEKKGYIESRPEKNGNMAEKAVYSLTEAGQREFEDLMMEISSNPIRIFLDFNAVIVNLDSIPPDRQQACLANIERNIEVLKGYLDENMAQKEDLPDIPETGKAVLRQQMVLVQALEGWLGSLKEHLAETAKKEPDAV